MTDPLRAATNAVIDAAEACSNPVRILNPWKVTAAEADAASKALHDHFYPACPNCGHRP